MNFSDYLIATDIDGTLLGKGSVSVPRNLEAILRFRKNGGLFTLSTGRMHCNVRKSVPHLEEMVNAPAVFAGGAYIYDFQQKKSFCDVFIDEKDAVAIWEFICREWPTAHCRVTAYNEVRARGVEDISIRNQSIYDEGSLYFGPFSTWKKDDFYKFFVFWDHEEEVAGKRESFLAHFGDRFYLASSGSRNMEIQAKGTGKDVGIRKLRGLLKEKYGKCPTIIACGDFENDIGMLKEADISVCPANAMQSVKDICDYTLCHCSDGLLADVIERLERGTLTPKGK